MAASMRSSCNLVARITGFCWRNRPLNIATLCSVSSCHQNASVGIDIGLPPRPVLAGQMKERREYLKKQRSDAKLERAARLRQLEIPQDEVRKDWETTSAPYHIRNIGHHYNIFTDLFDGADFLSHVVMNITYPSEDGSHMPVHFGNVITPTEALNPPAVQYDCEPGSLWTLLMVNPDGHLIYNDAEYVHWLMCNIPGDHLDRGETVFDYLPVFPAKGTGYQRIVFVIFKQEQKIDLHNEEVPLPCLSLPARTFSTAEFYARYQDVITPAGLSFAQCRWDQSVTDIFHKTLDMREPIYEYDVPKVHVLPQKKWPHMKTLNYLRQYLPDD